MRYSDEAYLEVFPRTESKAETVRIETACETFRPSEDKELNNEEAVVTEDVEEENNGMDGNDIGTDS